MSLTAYVRRLAAAGAALAFVATGPTARAQDVSLSVGQAETTDKGGDVVEGNTSIQSSLGPYGDPGGLRAFLATKGVTYNFIYIGETFRNLSGGLKRQSTYQGRFEADLDVDLNKLAGWTGASFHTNFYQIHGRGASRNLVGNLMTVSGIEALANNRLYEVWAQQQFMDGMLSVRFGQLGADTEFLVSSTAALFFNNSLGWPEFNAANLPSSGPAYPFAAPGARVRFAPTKDLTFLAAVFDGDPAGPARPGVDPDPERRDPSNVLFRLRDAPLLIAEADYAYGAKDAAILPGMAKIGFWRHFGAFNDQRYDVAGLSLADPASSGVARKLRGDAGVYAVLDQTLYRLPNTDDQGYSAFVRLMGAPGDRNLVSFYADGGVTAKGVIPGRPDDTFGVSAAHLRISPRARGLDFDQIAFSATPQPVRSHETMIEATYQALIVPGWTIQPDVQYVVRPGANAPNARAPGGGALSNALVVGLRSSIRY